MREITAYLNFNGNCREAMEFYKKCLGGELEIMNFSEAKFDYPKEAKDNVLHAKLSKGPATLMASDCMPGQPVKQGTNVSLTINCESFQEIEHFFSSLSEGGKVTMPLQDTFWNARFGMITDRFGIHWMFNFDKKHK